MPFYCISGDKDKAPIDNLCQQQSKAPKRCVFLRVAIFSRLQI